MLYGNTVLLDYGKHLTDKSDFRIHHGFFNVDGAEILLSGNSGNNKSWLFQGIGHNHGAVILGCIGIFDLNGNSLFSYRENGILVENAGSHIAKLS